jgi:hypothetical protein
VVTEKLRAEEKLLCILPIGFVWEEACCMPTADVREKYLENHPKANEFCKKLLHDYKQLYIF